MAKPKLLSIMLLGSLLATGVGGSVSAQPWDRDWDRGPRRDRDWDRDRDWEHDRE
jgi:Ni/Co efflux regulator RcnB